MDFAIEQTNATPAKGDLTFAGMKKKGDAEAALAAAEVSLDLRYTTPGLQHNAIEPHATVAVWDGDHLTVHDTTQSIHQTSHYLAWRFGVPASHVRVRAEFLGAASAESSPSGRARLSRRWRRRLSGGPCAWR